MHWLAITKKKANVIFPWAAYHYWTTCATSLHSSPSPGYLPWTPIQIVASTDLFFFFLRVVLLVFYFFKKQSLTPTLSSKTIVLLAYCFYEYGLLELSSLLFLITFKTATLCSVIYGSWDKWRLWHWGR